MNHNLIIKDGDVTKVVKDIHLVDGVQFIDEKPHAGSMNPVTSDGVAKSNTDILDDGDEIGIDTEITGRDYYESHVVGKFYFEQGKLWKCTDKTRDGEPGSYTYTTKMTKQNGVVAIANDIVDENTSMGEVVAASLCNLYARLRSVESTVIEENLGERIADRLNVQTLLVGGEDV